MANRKTAVQESAQALFCAMADYLGESKVDKVFDLEAYKTYPEFKEEWDSKNKSMTVETVYKDRVDAPTVPLRDIEALFKSDNDWYKSSVQIAKAIIKQVQDISRNFTKIKTPRWSDLFYLRDDKAVAGTIAELYSLANATQKKINAQPNASRGQVFSQINKWSPADIYFSSEKAKKELKDLLQESTRKSLTFGQLNSLISGLMDSGDLLPLSLKQQTKEAHLLKVNFSRKDELKVIGQFKYDKLKPWKSYTKAKHEARYLQFSYDPKHPQSFFRIRHDPETPAFKAEIVHTPGGGLAVSREGSAAPEIMAEFMSMAEGNTNYSRKFISQFDKAEAEFKKIRNSKEYRDLGIRNRDKYRELREWHSANLFTNVMFPDLIRWLESDKERSTRWIQLLYAYATSRSETSAKFVIAK
jgi:hypothetical protein